MKGTRDALKDALKGCDREKIAAAIEISPGSLNNQVAGEKPYLPKGNTQNFVDRIMAFLEEAQTQTGRLTLLEYIAEEFGCILVKNPAVRAAESPAAAQIAEILHEFARVIDEVAKANEDTSITKYEGETIRQKWEVMKRAAEEFVLACETGSYERKDNGPQA